MATYKVLQDIEAEDKLVGPLTLWQFIYALVSGLCIYLGTIAVMKSVPYFLILLVPVALFVGFLAVPWGGDQPTEVWALAKLRFFLKPRRRIWDQTGMTELVTVTAPKHEERAYTNGLSQKEVNSRLRALASTLDSRGWAVKNVNVNVSTMDPSYSASDRLVDVSAVPQDVMAVDIRPDDDMLDERANPIAHTFDTMIDEAANEYHKALIDRMNEATPTPLPAAAPAQTPPAFLNNITSQPTPMLPAVPDHTLPAADGGGWAPAQPSNQAPPDFWFMEQPVNSPVAQTTAIGAPPVSQPATTSPIISTIPQAADPTADETALLERLKAQESQQVAAYGHLKTLKTPEQLEEEARLAVAAQAEAQAEENRLAAEAKAAASAVTAEKQAAIINLSRSNDLSIDTLARQAKQPIPDDNEVVISLR